MLCNTMNCSRFYWLYLFIWFMNWSCCGSWGSIVGEVIRPWTEYLRNHGSIHGGGKTLLISETSRPVLELYQTSYSVASMDSFWGMNWQGRAV
jgi:hypothetical protein